MKPSELNYYFCFIGPIDRDELDEKYPMGEGHLRRSIEEAYYRVTGEWASTCSSGWGVTPTEKDDAEFWLYSDDIKDSIILSYFDEGKKLPSRAYKAYYLLRKSEGKVYDNEN